MRGIKRKGINETDLFSGLKIFMVDKQRDEKMQSLKENLSLISNIEIDNSCFVRSVVEYFSDNPSELIKLKDYAMSQKGFSLLRLSVQMVLDGKTNEEIYEKVGINSEISESIRELNSDELKAILGI